MKDGQLDDLKQFIVAIVSQSEARLQQDISGEISSVVSASENRLRSEFHASIHSEITVLRAEMADGFAGVAEAIEGVLHQAEERDAVVDRRLAKLEQLAA